MVWRGPMVTQALTADADRDALARRRHLVIDMPPGTGDIQLTLAQQVPVTGAVIVTTPQDIALLDARKGLKMFEKVGIPILGIVENMSIHICSKCGHAEHIFGSGGGDRMAKDYEVEMLGALPLAMAIREQMDGGKPTVEAEPEGAATEIYKTIARRVAVKIAEKAKDHQQVPQHQGDEHLIPDRAASRRPISASPSPLLIARRRRLLPGATVGGRIATARMPAASSAAAAARVSVSAPITAGTICVLESSVEMPCAARPGAGARHGRRRARVPRPCPAAGRAPHPPRREPGAAGRW
jgi:hypothetical protein